MSDLFGVYERRYIELSANLREKCTDLQGEQKKQKLSEMKPVIDEAEFVIRLMELEARSLQPNVKALLLAKWREYKSDLERLLSGNLNQESGMADTLTASADLRARMITLREKLDKLSDRVENSRRTMLETEELNLSILEDLFQIDCLS